MSRIIAARSHMIEISYYRSMPASDLSSARQMRPSCRLRGWIGDHLPGSGGRRPPSASIARAMSAVGLWKPKAIRVMTLILVFTDSIRPLLSPWSRVAWMLGRCLRIFFPSSVNSGMRQRAAQDSQRVRACLPSSPFEFERGPQPFFEQVCAVEVGVGFLDPGEFGILAAGEVLGVFPQRVAGAGEAFGVAGRQADGPAAVPDGADGPGLGGGAPDLGVRQLRRASRW